MKKENTHQENNNFQDNLLVLHLYLTYKMFSMGVYIVIYHPLKVLLNLLSIQGMRKDLFIDKEEKISTKRLTLYPTVLFAN